MKWRETSLSLTMFLFSMQDSNSDYFYKEIVEAGNGTKNSIQKPKENDSAQNGVKQKDSKLIKHGLKYQSTDVESKEAEALEKFETSNLSTSPKLKSKESTEQLTTGNTHVDKIIRGTLFKNVNNL